MTDPIEAARLEHEHPGREISQAEQDGWFKIADLNRTYDIRKIVGGCTIRTHGFDPTAPISPLSARLLAASNALHSSVDYSCGGSFAPVGETKHYQREPK